MHESMHAESFQSCESCKHACMQMQIHLRLLLECPLRRRSSSRVRLANSRMRASARSGSINPPPGSGSGGQCVVSQPTTQFEWMISGRTGGPAAPQELGIGSGLTSGAERGRVGALNGAGGSHGAKAPTFVAIIIPLTFSRRRVSQSALPRRS